MKNILFKSFAVLAAGFMLGGCEENAIEDFNEPAKAGAFIKFVHAAPDAPAVNYFLGSSKISAVPASSAGEVQGIAYTGSNFVFPNAYGYANVPAGSQTLQAIGLDNAVVSSSTETLEEGGYYTVYLLDEGDDFRSLVLSNNMPATTDYSRSYLRLVNMMTDTGEVFDAVLVKKATTESAEVRIPLVDNIGATGQSAIVDFDPNDSYVVEVTKDGQTTVFHTSSSFTPVAGRVYTLILRGDPQASFGSNLYRDR